MRTVSGDEIVYRNGRIIEKEDITIAELITLLLLC